MMVNIEALYKDRRWEIIFWIFILVMAPVGASMAGESMLEATVFRVVGLVTKILAAYALADWLIPRYLVQRQFFRFWLYTGVLIVVFSYLARILNVHVAERLFGYGDQESLLLMIQDFQFTISAYSTRVFSVVLLFLFIKFGRDQIYSQQLLAQMDKEKTTAELNFLKAQMHPHFLFNTLNNLYTLTLEKSDEAPKVVAQLAEILDYLLYQCNGPRVNIAKEVVLLENYLALEQLRYDDRLVVRFEQAIDNSAAQMAPLLLISPVENAFKHGVSNTSDAAFVHIQLQVTAGELLFVVENSRAEQATTDAGNYKGGIGLKNLRSQLDLIYPDSATLVVEELPTTFRVVLKIQL